MVGGGGLGVVCVGTGLTVDGGGGEGGKTSTGGGAGGPANVPSS